MSDHAKPNEERNPLSEDKDGPLAEQGWHGGSTFFEESGGRPADPDAGLRDSQYAGGGEGHLPASEAGMGMVPEDDERKAGGDTHLPASESDTAPLQNESGSETLSYPGKGGPGTFPPPG